MERLNYDVLKKSGYDGYVLKRRTGEGSSVW